MINAYGMKDPTDPTDFTTHEALARLDTSLRCPICKEFLDAPMNLNCGHSFCSLCIREYLRMKEECPCCRARPALEIHLKKNLALEEAMFAWKDSRQRILHALRPPQDDERPRKKLKLTESEAPSPTKSRPTIKSPGKSSGEAIELADSDEDLSTPDLVVCPICSKRMQLPRLNDHLDRNCQDKEMPRLEPGQGLGTFFAKASGSTAKSTSKPISSKPKPQGAPVPKFSYDAMKVSQLKSKLSDYGLPESGPRDTLVARLEHWSKIYNANLDRREDQQSSDSALKAELKRWENDKGKQAAKGKTELPQDLREYEKAHESSFASLIAEARTSLVKAKSSSSQTASGPVASSPPVPPPSSDDVVLMED